MALWVTPWDFLIDGHVVRGAGSSNPGRGIIVGEIRQLAGFSPSNMPYIVNSKFI